MELDYTLKAEKRTLSHSPGVLGTGTTTELEKDKKASAGEVQLVEYPPFTDTS
jgi:hypothetical protein